MAGLSNVGKSALILRYVRREFALEMPPYTATVGADYVFIVIMLYIYMHKTVIIDGRLVRLQIVLMIFIHYFSGTPPAKINFDQSPETIIKVAPSITNTGLRRPRSSNNV